MIPAVHAAGDSIIRVGLVGCGGRGSGAAINAMNADPNVRIVALSDLFDDSIQRCRTGLSKRFPEQFTVDPEMCFDGFDGYEKLMQTDIDVVLLASPPHYRPDHIESAVQHDKQIFCEKPVATDIAGLKRVEAACEKANEKGLNIVSGLCWRYHKGLKQTVDKVLDGAIGEIRSIQVDYLTSPIWIKAKKPDETEMQYQCRNWYYYTWLSGDHIVEQTIHSLDKAMWLRGDQMPVSAVGLGGRQRRSDLTQGNIYDHFSVVYQWDDDVKCHAYTRQMSGCFNQTEDFVYGTTGSAQLIANKIQSHSGDWQFEGESVQMHQAEQDEFFAAVAGRRDRIDNSLYMCRSTAMAILGREATYTGKELTYQELLQSNLDLSPEAYAFDAPAPEVKIRQPGKYKLA